MTVPDTSNGNDAIAGQGWPWLKIILVASLALNLLLVGGAAARFFIHGPPGHTAGFGDPQMIPRRFLSDLDSARRAELLSVFKDFRREFRDGRKRGREQMGKLASALEADPFDESAVKNAVGSFTDGGAALMRHGADAALVFIGKLTPDERKLLAKHIRLRDMDRHQRHGPEGEDH
jgi:uncharacterized membrane protein